MRHHDGPEAIMMVPRRTNELKECKIDVCVLSESLLQNSLQRDHSTLHFIKAERGPIELKALKIRAPCCALCWHCA